MTYTLITDNQTLADFCRTDSRVLALDTEFIRTRTYYAKPGLYQVYDGQQTVLIDPLSVSDLSPLWRIFHDSSRTWVLHAGGEDLELLLQQSGALPACIHDTQIAAAFLGMGSQLGFAPLVENLLDVHLEKAHARTDWLARPLSSAQLTYAADDVIYLYPIYQQLMAQLAEQGLMDHFKEECTRAVVRRSKSVNPELAYLDVKNASTLDSQALAILQQLCQWRLGEARRRDLALNFVVREAHLFRVAERAPLTLADLAKLDLDPMEIRRHGDTLLNLVQQGLASPEQWPQPIQRLIDHPGYKAELKRIKSVIDATAKQVDIPAEVIASKRLMHQYMTWKWHLAQDPDNTPILLQGWRKALLAEVL